MPRVEARERRPAGGTRQMGAAARRDWPETAGGRGLPAYSSGNCLISSKALMQRPASRPGSPASSASYGRWPAARWTSTTWSAVSPAKAVAGLAPGRDQSRDERVGTSQQADSPALTLPAAARRGTRPLRASNWPSSPVRSASSRSGPVGSAAGARQLDQTCSPRANANESKLQLRLLVPDTGPRPYHRRPVADCLLETNTAGDTAEAER